jgi:hypothetical protein
MSGRIGKVRMKATGFEFRVIEGVRDPSSDIGAKLLEHARVIASAEPVAGFAIISFDTDGRYRAGFRWDKELSPIPMCLVPAYVAEVFRRELITGDEAEAVFDSKFEWVE